MFIKKYVIPAWYIYSIIYCIFNIKHMHLQCFYLHLKKDNISTNFSVGYLNI